MSPCETLFSLVLLLLYFCVVGIHGCLIASFRVCVTFGYERNLYVVVC